MRDFTLNAYRQYLEAIKASYPRILSFADFFSLAHPPDSFVIVRHDVDRKPKNALKMARLENQLGVISSYYFRTKPHVFKAEIISEIAGLGHEIGYHYESLADTRGDYTAALNDFQQNLEKLRKIVPIHTIAMHGSPLSKYDNLDLWRNQNYHSYLKNHLEIYGELYLDINYVDIGYITDTGRNWSAAKANKRDMVASGITPDFNDGRSLLECFRNVCYPKIVFQIHPERWSDTGFEHNLQMVKDQVANFIKTIVR